MRPLALTQHMLRYSRMLLCRESARCPLRLLASVLVAQHGDTTEPSVWMATRGVLVKAHALAFVQADQPNVPQCFAGLCASHRCASETVPPETGREQRAAAARACQGGTLPESSLSSSSRAWRTGSDRACPPHRPSRTPKECVEGGREAAGAESARKGRIGRKPSIPASPTTMRLSANTALNAPVFPEALPPYMVATGSAAASLTPRHANALKCQWG